MKWILLPDFDGTGMLFATLLRALPPRIEPVVVAYPVSRVLTHRFSVVLEFDENFAPPALKHPLLYLQAGKDRLLKPRNFEIAQRRYPETHLQRIESPHLILQVQPDASVGAISEFLARTQPASMNPIKNAI
jgi:pimeloyl-ACP methyl ester carboxylesterase